MTVAIEGARPNDRSVGAPLRRRPIWVSVGVDGCNGQRRGMALLARIRHVHAEIQHGGALSPC
ncbi:MAG: hypothetical protein ACRENE_24080 [Polyangiaceae bacterium]